MGLNADSDLRLRTDLNWSSFDDCLVYVFLMLKSSLSCNDSSGFSDDYLFLKSVLNILLLLCRDENSIES